MYNTYNKNTNHMSLWQDNIIIIDCNTEVKSASYM